MRPPLKDAKLHGLSVGVLRLSKFDQIRPLEFKPDLLYIKDAETPELSVQVQVQVQVQV
jgi:hypothetical protein